MGVFLGVSLGGGTLLEESSLVGLETGGGGAPVDSLGKYNDVKGRV